MFSSIVLQRVPVVGVVCIIAFTVIVNADTAAQSPIAVEKIFLEKKTIDDLDTAASGYIYRSDANGPEIYIKLGDGENTGEYNGVLKNSEIYSNIKKADVPSVRLKQIPADRTVLSKTEPQRFPVPNYEANSDNEKYSYPIVMEKYHGKDEENFEFSRQIEGSELPESEIEIPALDEESYDVQSPVTYFNSKAAGYEEQSQGYYDSGNKKNGYVAPLFQVPDPSEVKFNDRASPVKYPLSKLIPAVVNEETPEYEGEDSGHSSQYVHHDDYHEPEKYRYASEGGKSYKSGHHSAHGEKGDKGYKKYHDFDEEEMGHHGKEGKKGYHKGKSGYHKDHHDDAEKHGEFYQGKHGEKGHKYGESAGHKKGHKTTGYHNIFHKDEYKKEQKFYDDAHKHRYHDKHGSHHGHHYKKHGGKLAGGHHDSSYDDGHKGSSSKFKKGHYDQDHKGHKGESGHESHYNHFQDYDKKGGHSDHEKHGHHDGGGHDYHY